MTIKNILKFTTILFTILTILSLLTALTGMILLCYKVDIIPRVYFITALVLGISTIGVGAIDNEF